MGFRAYSTKLDGTGAGSITFEPNNRAKEWAIHQLSVKTVPYLAGCQVEVNHAGFFRCASPQGSLDTATGPPYIVCFPNESVTIQWVSGPPNGTAQCNIWYEENPVGTSALG